MKAFGELVLVLLATAFRIFVGITLWKWFFVPLGLPPIGVWHYWGITLFVGVAQTHAFVEDSAQKKMGGFIRSCFRWLRWQSGGYFNILRWEGFRWT